MWRSLCFCTYLVACTPPNVDHQLLTPKYSTPTRSNPSWIFGTWEVLFVDGALIDALSEDDIPFHLLQINAEGYLWLDTFLTEYTISPREPDGLTISYNNIGHQSTLRVKFLDQDNAEIVENRQGNQQQEPQTCRLVVRRLQ
jgi:hypothetical protein